MIYSDGFSILGTKHFVGTTHEQHVYKKTLSLSKISSFGRCLLSTFSFNRFVARFLPTVEAVEAASRKMGVWNLGDLGLSGKVECQAYISPRVAEKIT